MDASIELKKSYNEVQKCVTLNYNIEGYLAHKSSVKTPMNYLINAREF